MFRDRLAAHLLPLCALVGTLAAPPLTQAYEQLAAAPSGPAADGEAPSSPELAAARTCRRNLAALAAAEQAYGLRNRRYTRSQADLVGTPEGLTRELRCPLRGQRYDLRLQKNGQRLTVRCRHGSRHARVHGERSDYKRVLLGPGQTPREGG